MSLAVCITFESSYAMTPDIALTPSLKRKREKNEEEGENTKKQRAYDSRDTLKDSPFYPLPDDVIYFSFQHIDSLFKMWNTRAVCKHFKYLVDVHTTELDLRGRQRIHNENRIKLMNAANPMRIPVPPFHNNRDDYYFWKGTLFFKNHDISSPIASFACEPSGEALWATDEVFFNNQKAPNPLKAYYSRMDENFSMDFRDFTNLTYLNLQENKVVNSDALKTLTNLEELNLGWATEDIQLADLTPLTNLRVLKLDLFRKDVGKCFNFPALEELHILPNYDDEGDHKDQMMSIAEILFDLIAHDENLRNHEALPTLQERYIKWILLPNQKGVGLPKRETTYPFELKDLDIRQVSKEEIHCNDVAYRGDEVKYFNRLLEETENAPNMSWNEIWGQDPEILWLWERNPEIEKIILSLLKISGHRLKIFRPLDNSLEPQVGSLEEYIEKNQEEFPAPPGGKEFYKKLWEEKQ